MRFIGVLVGLILLASAVGCSHQDFGVPVTGLLTGSGTKSAKRPGAADAAERANRLTRVLAEWSAGRNTTREYHLGAEDVLDIGVMSLEEIGKIARISRQVQPDGTVALPLAGPVRVAGLTVSEAEAVIRAALDGRFIRGPEVAITVTEYRGSPIVITGAVNKPGVYYLKNDRRSVLEMLAEADGLSTMAGNEVLLIRSGDAAGQSSTGETNSQRLVSIDLRRLLDGGDLRLNAWVTRGDMITVPPRTKEYIYVLGYVQRPGGFEIDRDNPPAALQAVAFAGGLTSTARAENSFVLRETETGQKMIPVDLTRMARGDSVAVTMQGGDTLVVGSSFIARLSEFVRPSVSAGMSFSPIP
jgi:polysaccharide export outer membrane protein